ncbi:MAG: LPXTG cell wall anchor domain-containing protein [Ruminococcus sp.]|nr:LPXTG cell wall anchor domain-containing protein [Ruminococcus sp.]
MRNSLKRTLAAVSVAAMAMTGVAASAMTASAEGAVELTLDQIYAEPGQTVTFGMNVANNATNGWAAGGFSFTYDERLTLGVDAAGELLMTEDLASLGMTFATAVDTEVCQFATTWAASKPVTKEGVLFTVEFTVPEDAQPGDVFPITMVVDKFNDDNATAVEYTAVDGWIAIEAEEEETTTTTEETTTTTTEETTTTAEETTTTTTTTTKVEAPDTGAENTTAALGLAGLLTAAAAAVVLKKKNN